MATPAEHHARVRWSFIHSFTVALLISSGMILWRLVSRPITPDLGTRLIEVSSGQIVGFIDNLVILEIVRFAIALARTRHGRR